MVNKDIADEASHIAEDATIEFDTNIINSVIWSGAKVSKAPFKRCGKERTNCRGN